jgi:retron-type reverse transcriptase
VGRFFLDLEGNLLRLRRELLDHSYTPGPHFNFTVYEPKERVVSAAPFRDRVVHHALCNVIEPLWERRFVYDTWANRIGKGTHRAMDRFQRFAQAYRYVLMCDVRKYFASIDHQVLKEKVRRVVRCKDTLWLAEKIIDHCSPPVPVSWYFVGDDLFTPLERGQGLPIGNLTSQLFANVYLDALDHYVKETLRAHGYVRYMDDFAVFGNDKTQLWSAREQIRRFLADDRLKIHERKSRVFRTDEGVEFLGFRIWPCRRRLKRQCVRRMARRLRWFKAQYQAGQMPASEIGQRIRCWVGHVRHGDTKMLVESVLNRVVFVRDRVA